MHITEGTLADYKQLSQFHYRTATSPAPRKIFALKRKNETIGAIVYSHPPPICFGRSKIWKGTIQQLQQEVSTITRVVLHPKYRSIGLGTKLVQETLPKAGTPHVETVAVMARYNPFFEKAGMQRIAESQSSPHVTEALRKLSELGFEPALMTNAEYLEQKIRQTGQNAIRNVLIQLSKRAPAIRRRLTCLSSIYPKHHEFTQKINQLDPAGLAKTLKRLSFTNQTKTYLHWTNPAVAVDHRGSTPRLRPEPSNPKLLPAPP
jgi:GNAT superfamily N-acetyltransferase